MKAPRSTMRQTIHAKASNHIGPPDRTSGRPSDLTARGGGRDPPVKKAYRGDVSAAQRDEFTGRRSRCTASAAEPEYDSVASRPSSCDSTANSTPTPTLKSLSPSGHVAWQTPGAIVAAKRRESRSCTQRREMEAIHAFPHDAPPPNPKHSHPAAPTFPTSLPPRREVRAPMSWGIHGGITGSQSAFEESARRLTMRSRIRLSSKRAHEKPAPRSRATRSV